LLQPLLDGLVARLRDAMPPLPVVETADAKIVFEASRGGELPVLIKNGCKASLAFERWSFEFFRETFGHVLVNTDLYSDAVISRTSMRELIDQVLSTKDAYLQEWWYELDAPELVQDIDPAPCFDYSLNVFGLRHSTLWIGAAGSFTKIHKDWARADTWSSQIRGRKRWFLMRPDTQLFCKADGTPDVDRLLSEYRETSWVLDMQPGDMLYVPKLWWHATQALEPNITLRNVYVSQDQTCQYFYDVLSVPILLALQGDDIREHDPQLHHKLILLTKSLNSLLEKHKPRDVDMN
jgi:hypothetical protein